MGLSFYKGLSVAEGKIGQMPFIDCKNTHYLRWRQALGPRALRGVRAPFNLGFTFDAFPRSASSYAVRSIVPALRKSTKFDNRSIILHHTHRRETLEFSLAVGAPTVSFIRHPLNAISSAFLYFERRRKLSDLCESYLAFYLPLLKTIGEAESPRPLIVRFEKIVNDLASVFADINQEFNLDLEAPSDMDAHKEEIVSAAAEKGRTRYGERVYRLKVGVPDAERESLKRQVESDLSRNDLLRKCEMVYGDILTGNE